MVNRMLVRLVVTSHLILSVTSYCPPGCTCNNSKLMVTCNQTDLEMLPITLNPHITSLNWHNSRVHTVDDSLQFYEALLSLNISHNKINIIQDGAFSYQVRISYCLQALHFISIFSS